MPKVITALFILVGIGHLLPGVGVLSSTRVAALYEVSFEGPDMGILMRHRAVLFILIGAFFIYAGLKPELRLAGLIAGIVSMGSFVWLCLSASTYNDAVRKVFVGDIVGLVLFGVILVLHYLESSSTHSGV